MNIDKIKIIQLRKQMHWSQEELAAAADLSTRTVQRLETSGRCSLDTARAVSAAFAMTVDDLLPKEINRNWIAGPLLGATTGALACIYAYWVILTSSPNLSAAVSENWLFLVFVTCLLAFTILFPAHMIRKHWNYSPT